MMLKYLLAAVCAVTLAGGVCRAADDDGSQPPGGITATPAMTLKRLLTLNRVAEGSLPPGTPHTRIEVDAYQSGSLTGTKTTYRSGKNVRIDIVLGVFHSSYGTFDGKQWEHNRNGLTRLMGGVHERDAANEAALLRATAASSSDVALLGAVQAPVAAYVVRVSPRGGRIEYLYYDRSSYLLVRDEEAYLGKRVTYTYDDYRVTSGVRQPWHTHMTNGIVDNDEDVKVTSLSYGVPVDAAKLAIPPSAATLSLDATRVTLPAKFSGDRIILTVQMGRHKVNLQMDSGASEILLNRDVGDATGVQSYGTRTGETAGKYSEADALIPKIDFGGAAMQNIAATTAPYVDETYDGAPVAGLIGYDFIAGAVMHIDYYNSTVEAINAASFTPPAGAVALPIRLDDGVPVVTAKIGAATGEDFIVDTGADTSAIFSAFAQAHPSDVSDQGLGQTMTESYPFINHIYGVGGKVEVRPVQVASVTIGSIKLPKWLFDVSSNAPTFEDEDYDGLIGQDILRNFDVYFDYSRSMMYLVPNDRFKQRYA